VLAYDQAKLGKACCELVVFVGLGAQGSLWKVYRTPIDYRAPVVLSRAWEENLHGPGTGVKLHLCLASLVPVCGGHQFLRRALAEHKCVRGAWVWLAVALPSTRPRRVGAGANHDEPF
jgi:hypothetical protein